MEPEDKKDSTNTVKRTEESGLLQSRNQSFAARSHSFSYAVKKIEKLASGLHLVTNFIPTTESVRERTRGLSLRVLSDFLTLGNGSSDQRNVYATIENSIIELVTLLNVAHAAEYVSSMNKEVLTREYTELLEFIKENQTTLTSEDTVITEEFFDVLSPKVSQIGSLASKGQVPTEPTTPTIKDTLKQTSRQGQTSVRTQRDGSIVKRRDDRRSTILNLLKSQNKIGVKDISPLISGCSEKTLQRELLAMVDEGILTKEGERRWSTYSLAT